jgi:alpha-D-ribose 1-methylphosphonate 5-triphosphate diphosphatase PhnM
MATVMGALRTSWAAVRIPATRSPRELAEAGEIGILSSDYVPAALLMAPLWLTDMPAVGRG